MALDADIPLSKRIELARLRRGLSRRALGDLVGRSSEWVRQVERGERSVDRLSILLRLATVLKTDDRAAFLAGATARAPAPSPQRPDVRRLLDAVYTPPPPEPVARSEAAIDHVWTLWSESAEPYTESLARLPPLLPAADRLASILLGHLGEATAALLAAQRAMARAPDDLTSVAVYADALVGLGEADVAEALCRRTLAATGPAPHAGLGPLQLSGACAAIAAHHPQAAHAWLAKAAATARQHPDERLHPVDVEIQGVRAALRLGHLPDAIRLAARIDLDRRPGRMPRSRGWITIASVHARAGNAPAALLALGKAERACAEELRVNAEARQLIGELLGSAEPLIRADLLALAARTGVA